MGTWKIGRLSVAFRLLHWSKVQRQSSIISAARAAELGPRVTKKGWI